MTKDEIERIKRIERIEYLLFEIHDKSKTDVLKNEYIELIKGLSDEAKKEKINDLLDFWYRDSNRDIVSKILDEIISSLDRDEDKLELFNMINKWNYKIPEMLNKTVLSLSTDEAKIKLIKEEGNSYIYSLVDLIASLSTDEFKIEIIERESYLERGIIIASLSSDKLKIEQMEKFQDNMTEADYIIIISSLSTDELKIKQMEQKKEKIGRRVWETITKSLINDEAKIYALEKYYVLANYGEIIASLSSDELKLEQLEKYLPIVTNESKYQIGIIIASLSSDELKLEQLERLKDELCICSRSGKEGVTEIIKSLSNDEIKLQTLYEYKEKKINVEKIILSLSTDEAKVKAIDEIGYISEEIILSLSTDEAKLKVIDKMKTITKKIIISISDAKKKLELIEKHITSLRHVDIDDIIKSIKSDEERIRQIQSMTNKLMIVKEKIKYYPCKEMIASFSTDEAKLEYIKLGYSRSKGAFLLLETDEAKLKLIELYKDEQYRRNVTLAVCGTVEGNAIKKIIFSLNSNEKKIEALLMIQENIDEKTVIEIIQSLDYYDDFNKENIIIKLSNGTEIRSSNRTLIIPIEKIMTNVDAKYFSDCYFKYFNSEILNEQHMFQVTNEEIRDFLKFAKTLGCFSKEKVLDENGRETEVSLGQKASSLLAQLLKTDMLSIRTISWTVRFNANGC